MRLLALLLLLGNAAFFAWTYYAAQLGSSEAHLVSQQINPEAIRLLTPQELAARKVKAPAAAHTAACMEWGAFTRADVPRAQAALQQTGVPMRVAERRVEDAAGWWVYMPPQGSRQGANQKLGELKRLGVDEYFMVQDDPRFRFAISLGLFRTEEAARARLEQLRAQGVRSALVGQRTTPVRGIYLQLQDYPEDMQQQLAGLKEAFPSTEWRECQPADPGG